MQPRGHKRKFADATNSTNVATIATIATIIEEKKTLSGNVVEPEFFLEWRSRLELQRLLTSVDFPNEFPVATVAQYLLPASCQRCAWHCADFGRLCYACGSLRAQEERKYICRQMVTSDTEFRSLMTRICRDCVLTVREATTALRTFDRFLQPHHVKELVLTVVTKHGESSASAAEWFDLIAHFWMSVDVNYLPIDGIAFPTERFPKLNKSLQDIGRKPSWFRQMTASELAEMLADGPCAQPYVDIMAGHRDSFLKHGFYLDDQSRMISIVTGQPLHT